MEEVILVDREDKPLGLMEKMEAHRKGLLHRAFSVFIFNLNNELMLQQRALGKYHSPGLWSNTCCSHPRDGEAVLEAGHRRLKEEMGFDCQLEKTIDFIYYAELDKGMIEHEFDHVLVGRFDGFPEINPQEVHSWKWIKLEDLSEDMEKNPEHYTVWFRIIFNKVKDVILGQAFP